MEISMRDYMRVLRNKKGLNLLKKGCLAIGLVCGLGLLVSACTPEKPVIKPLTKLQKRRLAFNLLAAEHILVIHRGNQFDVLIPTAALFQPRSTNMTSAAAYILSPLYHAINTYDVETVRINGLMMSHTNSNEKLLTRARAGIVGQHLWFDGLNRQVPMVYGGLRGTHLPTSDLTKDLHAPLIWVHWHYIVKSRMYD
jgi:hypothetical protein